MSSRIVVLGPFTRDSQQAIELTDGNDAGALLGGDWRVSLARYSGELADATVIVAGKSMPREATDSEWNFLRKLAYKPREFTIEVPIPVGVVDGDEGRYERGTQ